jgi:hypothetical protein
MNVAIDTNVEIGSVPLAVVSGDAVGAAVESLLRRWMGKPDLRGCFLISVSHTFVPPATLSVVAVYAKGQAK